METTSPWAIAPFRFDVTPPIGHALLGGWIPPVAAVDDPLEAIGFVLLGAGAPIVVCAVDWAGLLNDAHLTWTTALAEAAGTTPDRVALHCVHQHNAPFVCPTARAAAAEHLDLPLMYDTEFFARCVERSHHAVAAALPQAQRLTHVAHSRAKVDRVASNRRVARDATGRVRAMRLSSCTDPELTALPEGTIDPWLQTVAFYGEGGRRIIACHHYATHPMSFYRDGRVTSDFCGLARKRRQSADPGCTHVYFTGCAGNVSAGKYNDGSRSARLALTERMHAGMITAERMLSPQPLRTIDWRTEDVLPHPLATPTAEDLANTLADPHQSTADRLIAAFRLGWRRRFEQGRPLLLSRLRLNEISLLHLPAEMFVEYQLRAQSIHPGAPVAVAAYGDDGPWYVPTKEEYPNGGYEVGVAFCRDEIDSLMMEAIRRLLA